MWQCAIRKTQETCQKSRSVWDPPNSSFSLWKQGWKGDPSKEKRAFQGYNATQRKASMRVLSACEHDFFCCAALFVSAGLTAGLVQTYVMMSPASASNPFQHIFEKPQACSAAPEDLPPVLHKRYRLMRLLGTGTFASIFAAEDMYCRLPTPHGAATPPFDSTAVSLLVAPLCRLSARTGLLGSPARTVQAGGDQGLSSVLRNRLCVTTVTQK